MRYTFPASGPMPASPRLGCSFGRHLRMQSQCKKSKILYWHLCQKWSLRINSNISYFAFLVGTGIRLTAVLRTWSLTIINSVLRAIIILLAFLVQLYSLSFQSFFAVTWRIGHTSSCWEARKRSQSHKPQLSQFQYSVLEGYYVSRSVEPEG